MSIALASTPAVGRELDLAVAAAVFPGADPDVIPSYSQSIAGAFVVVEELRRRGWGATIENRTGEALARWRVAFTSDRGRRVWNLQLYGMCQELPEAICRAALKAIASEGRDDLGSAVV